MINPKELKCNLVDSYTQLIVFKRDGTYVDSCQSIKDVSLLSGQSVYDFFPLIGSMRDPISIWESTDTPIRLPGVDFSILGKTGIFDFELFAHPTQPDLILWLLIDNTRLYSYLQEIQQQRNLLLIEKEDRENGRLFNR